MDEKVETVCRAIHILYSGGAESHAAQQYLQEFQESEDSWMICDQIIGQHTDSLACYFAAQTLRTKIRKRLKQLPMESYEMLRSSLLQHLNRHGAQAHDQQSEATSTQLCLAIADLYIQVPLWNNWILELLKQSQTLEGDRTVMTLTLLQVFPEEAMEIQGVGENRRNAIRDELAACAVPIIQFLTHVLHKYHTDASMLKRVLKCLETNLMNQSMKTDEFAQSQLLTSVFQILTSPHVPSSLHEAATNVIVAALVRAEDVEGHIRLAKVLQKGVVTLVEPFKQAENAEDFDRLQNFARIFVETCESFYINIVSSPTTDVEQIGSLICLELLILIASNHDYSLIEMTFNVWYRITEELFKYDDDMHILKFKPFADRFIMALYEHSKLDADDINEVPDEKSEFGEFRSKVVEAVRDVVFVVNTENCVNAMYEKLRECASRPDASWEESEAALFIMSCVVQNLLAESDGKMPDVLTSIIQLPVNSPPALICTSLALIGDSNDWLRNHPALLPEIMKWVLQFAIDQRYTLHVSSCVDRIASQCSTELVWILPHLFELIAALEQSNQNGMKVEEAINGITRAASLIISKLGDVDAKQGMQRLCEPIVRNLNLTIEMSSHVPATPSSSTADQITNNNNNNNNNEPNPSVLQPLQPLVIADANKENVSRIHHHSRNSNESWAIIAQSPLIWIDRIASVFKDVWKPKDKHDAMVPWIDLATQFIEALIKATKRFESNSRMVEHTIRSIRMLFRSLGKQSMNYVEPIVNLIIDIYPKYHHSCCLYMAAVIVDEYGQIPTMRGGLLKMLDTLATVTFTILNQPDGCLNNPDVVDDFFRLAQRFASRVTSLFFMSPVSVDLFTCAIANLSLDHREANKSASRFLIEVVEQLRKAKEAQYTDEGVVAAQQLLSNQGGQLMIAALNSALFHVSGSLKRDMAEIIAVIGKLDKLTQKQWLIVAISQLPNSPVRATPAQLSDFVESVVREREPYAVNAHIRELNQLFN